MTRKNINNTIRSKINHWLESIEDEGLRKDISSSIIVTGGAIVSMLMNEKVNDFDVYFTDKKVAEKAAEHYLGLIGNPEIELGFPKAWEAQSEHRIDEDERVYLNVPGGAMKVEKTYPEDSRYNPLFISNNAITLQGDIQLIFRFIGDAEQIHTNYDFVHCTNYWKNGKLVLKEDALESILTKEMRYIGSKYPVSSFIRTRKYISRGFTINAGEMFKICWQINELDLTDVNVLREQLVGVDIFFFDMMLQEIEALGRDSMTTEVIFDVIDSAFNESFSEDE